MHEPGDGRRYRKGHVPRKTSNRVKSGPGVPPNLCTDPPRGSRTSNVHAASSERSTYSLVDSPNLMTMNASSRTEWDCACQECHGTIGSETHTPSLSLSSKYRDVGIVWSLTCVPFVDSRSIIKGLSGRVATSAYTGMIGVWKAPDVLDYGLCLAELVLFLDLSDWEHVNQKRS